VGKALQTIGLPLFEMSQTTIQISEELRDELRNERKSHESNYGDTIERLLDDGTGGQLWTERELKDLIQREIEQVSRR